ncbi:unnamed protein product [Ambrosiozyma monospora]|uniref:Unnamed protein product n=1 Tax=Ambrosiozyma monospora TaxID=43982 RepID=A0A9W6Z3W5_AMBMO|nr:unnamed protein product [Ambrosiozyma monospora]
MVQEIDIFKIERDLDRELEEDRQRLLNERQLNLSNVDLNHPAPPGTPYGPYASGPDPATLVDPSIPTQGPSQPPPQQQQQQQQGPSITNIAPVPVPVPVSTGSPVEVINGPPPSGPPPPPQQPNIPNSTSSDKKKKPRPKKVSRFTICNVITIVLAILLVEFMFYFYPSLHVRLINIYRRKKYLPSKHLNFFIDHPVDDLTFRIPVYYSVDFNLPDFEEAVNIQLQGRLQQTEQVVLNYEFEFRQGDYTDFVAGKYSNPTFGRNALFLRMLLSTDNAIKVDAIDSSTDLFYTLESINSNDLPFFVTQLLIDYCFNNELAFYRIDNFFKVQYREKGRETMVHNDFNKFAKWNQDLTLSFVMLGDARSWDISKAIATYMKDLQSLNGIYNIQYSEWVTEINSTTDRRYIDKYFPIELSDLPDLSTLYEWTKKPENRSLLTNYIDHYYLVYFPIDYSEELLQDKEIKGKPIIESSENTFTAIPQWGLVYFAHSNDEERDSVEHFVDEDGFQYDASIPEVGPVNMKDCMWSFTESVLDYLELPNSNMSPKLRIDICWRTIPFRQ